MRADPVLALLVDHGFRTHYVPGTGSSYRTASRDYVRFCVKRGLEPWAVDVIAYCGWLNVTADRIQMDSLSVYMAGVRDTSTLQGYGWNMTGNEMVRRTM
jgi:hypothetical protein